MRVKFVFGLASLVLLVSISFIFLMKIKRSEIIDYNPTQDYHYTFENANSVKLELKNGKLILPSNLGKDKTAFLKVNIKSTLLGNFFYPHIEIKSQTQSVNDYFEYGGSGNRYLNISSLLLEETMEIELVNKYLEILEPTVELIYYTNSIHKDSKIMVISPHPDDAEISAFGLYSKFPNSFVLTLTAGENGPMHYDELFSDSLRHFLKKGQIRTINSISVPLQSGLNQNNIINLGYFDGTIKQMHDENPINVFSQTLGTDFIGTFRNFNISNLKDSLMGSSNWDSMIGNLEFVLKSYKPDIIVLPHPHMDNHSDHQFSTIGVIQALKKINYKNGELFFYANHNLGSEFFPFGNAGGSVSLPPNFIDGYHFNSVYSHPLTQEEQMEKVLALDAMNDLRPDTEWRFWDKLLKLSYENFKAYIKGQDNSYFRRGIRSNELFFVVPINDLYDEGHLTELLMGKSIDPL